MKTLAILHQMEGHTPSDGPIGVDDGRGPALAVDCAWSALDPDQPAAEAMLRAGPARNPGTSPTSADSAPSACWQEPAENWRESLRNERQGRHPRLGWSVEPGIENPRISVRFRAGGPGSRGGRLAEPRVVAVRATTAQPARNPAFGATERSPVSCLAVDIVCCKARRIRESVGSQTEVIRPRDFEWMVVGLPYDCTRITEFHKNDPATEMCLSQGT